MLDVNVFDQLHIGLATKDDIYQWSNEKGSSLTKRVAGEGTEKITSEVTKPETINYRTLKPERDGLFCEVIFGPTRDWECSCGKYKRVRYKGIVCERCKVEVTRSKVRRERMGYIELAAPVTHIWYSRGVPSRLGYLLNLAPKDLDKVIYFAAYMFTRVDTERRHADLPELQTEVDMRRSAIEKGRDVLLEERQQKLEADVAELEASGARPESIRRLTSSAERELGAIRRKADNEIAALTRVWDRFKSLKVGDLEGDETLYRDLKRDYGEYFEASMGASAIEKRLQSFDLEAESASLRETIESGNNQDKTRALKRLKVVNAFLTTGNKPEAMVLNVIPVIPPELRPMVQLDGGRFATSDLNDLYRRVINRNNRLKRLQTLNAPEIIVNNEKRMLQEAVDALFDNGRRGRPVTGPGNRALKSIADMLKGKQGRFRQNLLGKRVDYSGRSVIVVGPTLRLHQCGLPKQMALELFKPFVMKRLVDLNHAQNIRAAKRMVERGRSQVWDVLEEVITEHPVLLNRAPTLHRLGIQAFEPQLVEGKAIQLHPLVCGAFNADFDGDQMAVHVPLSPEAQAEARILMLSSNNILKPSDGRPVTMPTQDMITGIYHLTWPRKGARGEGRAFSSVAEATMAFDLGEVEIDAMVKILMSSVDAEGAAAASILETTLGRCIFNDALPSDYPFVNSLVDKKHLSRIVNDLAERYPKVVVAESLDGLKAAGYYWATRSGLTIAISDMQVPAAKRGILAKYEGMAERTQDQFDLGMLTDEERRKELIDIWTAATSEVAKEMMKSFSDRNPINQLVSSGASGNWDQVRQLAGIRGLVIDPKGEIIPRPITSSYIEGLSVLEYFIATHGARKGLADTALRTADSGYLTRRLVDVSQDVIIRELDCGTSRGLTLPIGEDGPDGTLHRIRTVETSVFARTMAADLEVDGEVLASAGDDVGDVMIDKLIAAGVRAVKVRSVLTCTSKVGTCALCYGRSLATGKLVDIGEAVGIISAQSIGEPGTQLTMRTFQQGGSASAEDITQGLPRVQELFEARTPKGEAPIAESSGRVSIEDTDRTRKIIIKHDDGSEDSLYPVSKRSRLLVRDGEHVQVGTQLVAGAADPKKVLRILGPRAVQKHLVDQVQETYRSQGVDIHDKHIEVIVRQMLRRVTVLDSGETNLLPGELIERTRFEEENRRVVAEGGKPAAGRPELLGITKASLATDSWLSAASFQETTKVLTEAAMSGRSDPLLGLKENVILGKLIPAGTGLSRYRDVEVEPAEEGRAAFERFGYSEVSGFGRDGLEPLLLEDDFADPARGIPEIRWDQAEKDYPPEFLS